ncbi:MAG TPA: hypothetical protein VII63_03810 [Caulobacteraceae bacterium]
MFRTLTMAGLVAAAAVGTAAAESSAVSAAFGNTIVSTYPDGRTAEIWLKPSGTYTGEGRRHDASSGKWDLKGGKICFHQHRPIPIGSFCTSIPSAGMGGSWKGKAPTGEPTTIRLVTGIVHGG